MHPINKKYFGSSGIQIVYNNGTASVLGYIVKQLGTKRFKVTSNGTTTYDVVLANTTSLAESLTPGHMTIPVTTPSGLKYVQSIYSTTLVTTDSTHYSWTLTPNGLAGVLVLPSPEVVAPVTNLHSSSHTTTTIVTNWTVPVNNFGYNYYIQWKNNGTTIGSHNITTSTTNTYTITGLTTGTTYSILVTSTTPYGSSAVVSISQATA